MNSVEFLDLDFQNLSLAPFDPNLHIQHDRSLSADEQHKLLRILCMSSTDCIQPDQWRASIYYLNDSDRHIFHRFRIAMSIIRNLMIAHSLAIKSNFSFRL